MPHPGRADIGDDIVAYLRTVSLAQIEGPRGLAASRQDLNERAAIRSAGKVRELIIELWWSSEEASARVALLVVLLPTAAAAQIPDLNRCSRRAAAAPAAASSSSSRCSRCCRSRRAC